MDAIIAAAIALVQEALQLAISAKAAAAEAHQAILDRMAAARASLAGDKTDAHAAVIADLQATQAQLDALKAQHANALAALGAAGR